MEDPRSSLQRAAAEAGLPESSFRPVRSPRWRPLLRDILVRFTGRGDLHGRWIWQDLRLPHAVLQLGSARESLTVLPAILPHRTPIWFIVEDFAGGKVESAWWVFETDTTSLVEVLGQHHLFEYAIVASDLAWMVAESHHDALVAVGAPVQAALESMVLERQRQICP